MDGKSYESYGENGKKCDKIAAGSLSGDSSFPSCACFWAFKNAAGCAEDGNRHTGVLCNFLPGWWLDLWEKGRKEKIFMGTFPGNSVFSSAAGGFKSERAGITNQDNAGADCLYSLRMQRNGRGDAFPLIQDIYKIFASHFKKYVI